MKHAPYLLHIILALALLLVGCHSDPRQVELIDRAEAVMDSLPEVALSLLDSVDSHRLLRADNARYALLLTQARDKNYIDITNDSLINIAVSYYAGGKELHYKMLAHYYHGRILYNARDYARSIVALLKAEKVAVELDDKYRLGLIYHNISNIYDNIYWGEGAIEYAQKSYDAYSQTQYHRHCYYSLLHLGIKHFNYYNYTESEKLFKTLLTQVQEQNDTILCIETLTKLASTYWAVNNYNKAITAYNEAIKLNLDKDIIGAAQYSRLSSSYIMTDQLEKGLKYANIAYEKDTAEVWGLYLYNEKCGNIEEALHYLQKEILMQNEILDNITTQSVLKSVDDYKSMEDRLEKQSHLYERIILIVVILTISIIALLIIRHRIKLNRYEIEQNLLQIQNLQNTLHVENRKTEILQKEINSLLSSHILALDELCNIYYESNSTTVYDKIVNTINKFRNNEDIIRKIESLVNKHKDNIMHDFRCSFPNLKPEDYLFFLFLVIGLPSRTIALILQVKMDIVYSRKSKLKRKISTQDLPQKGIYLKYFD